MASAKDANHLRGLLRRYLAAASPDDGTLFQAAQAFLTLLDNGADERYFYDFIRGDASYWSAVAAEYLMKAGLVESGRLSDINEEGLRKSEYLKSVAEIACDVFGEMSDDFNTLYGDYGEVSDCVSGVRSGKYISEVYTDASYRVDAADDEDVARMLEDGRLGESEAIDGIIGFIWDNTPIRDVGKYGDRSRITVWLADHGGAFDIEGLTPKEYDALAEAAGDRDGNLWDYVAKR